MTYKNGIKEYVLITVMFGLPMGALLGFVNSSITAGLISGIFSGLLFSFFMFLFSKSMEKKFAKMRAEIKKEKTVICDGAATVAGNGGWLFLCKDALEFYPHKINISTKEIKILLADITSVEVYKNQIILATAQGALSIVVCQSKEWQKHIQSFIL